MALKKTYLDSRNNVCITDAYHKIVPIPIGGLETNISVLIYNSQADRDAEKGAYKKIDFPINKTLYATYFAISVLDALNVNPIERGYVYLKTLTEYAGSVDILE